jgi:Glycine rich protein
VRFLGASRYVIGLCAAIPTAAGCAGAGGNAPTPALRDDPTPLTHSRTFKYTGEKQIFRVPRGLRQITIIGLGGKGAGPSGAYGGRVSALIPVTPGERLVVYVAGDASDANGGFNGGANGGNEDYCRCPGYGGGGASDVRMDGGRRSDRILVIGGGGGQGAIDPLGYGPVGVGGKGGGLTGGGGGESRYYECNGGGGSGGTQYAGGAGGAGSHCLSNHGNPGKNGTLGFGGRGAQNGHGVSTGGGGGGGGYYGGGGGGAGSEFSSSVGQGSGGGGGGGSSYVEPNATDVHMWQGWKPKVPNGLIVFTW